MSDPDLIDRVAKAIGDVHAMSQINDAAGPRCIANRYDMARAAMRVVVEACAKVCEKERDGHLDDMEGADSPEFELNSGAESALDRMAHLLRALLPPDAKEKPDAE